MPISPEERERRKKIAGELRKYNSLSAPPRETNIMHTHHYHCIHEHMAYCITCRAAYCKDCNKTWAESLYTPAPYWWTNTYNSSTANTAEHYRVGIATPAPHQHS